LSALGDIIHTVPAIQSLAGEFPEIEIHWLTTPPYHEFLSAVKGIDKVWAIDLKQGLAGIPGVFSVLQKVRREKFDCVIDFQGLLKSAIPARFSGAPQVFGPARSQAREPLASRFYTNPINVLGDRLHQVEYHHGLALGGVLQQSPVAQINLKIPEKAIDFVKTQLEQLQLHLPILLNPGGGWETKLWGPDNFARLSRLIEENLGVHTLFTYGPGEKKLVDSIAQLGPGPVRTFPTSIMELAALCKQSRLIVAGDTGPLHLGVAMGLPAVGILGPALPWRTGPFGSANISVTHSRPCPHPYRRVCKDHYCMDISVKDVFESVKARFEKEGAF
jgi:ADP-heptose:LPS heptosyltransferase